MKLQLEEVGGAAACAGAVWRALGGEVLHGIALLQSRPWVARGMVPAAATPLSLCLPNVLPRKLWSLSLELLCLCSIVVYH
jgi:hypothetical protein